MRMSVILAIGLIFGSNSIASAANTPEADAVLGKWWFPKRNGQMQIDYEGGVYLGKVIAYDDPKALDDKNPDPKLRNRLFIGISMLDKFKYDPKSKKWIDGTIYDGDSGKTYNCTMWFDKGNPNRLNARGYIGVSLFGRTEIFERVSPADEAAAAKQAGPAK